MEEKPEAKGWMEGMRESWRESAKRHLRRSGKGAIIIGAGAAGGAIGYHLGNRSHSGQQSSNQVDNLLPLLGLQGISSAQPSTSSPQQGSKIRDEVIDNYFPYKAAIFGDKAHKVSKEGRGGGGGGAKSSVGGKSGISIGINPLIQQVVGNIEKYNQLMEGLQQLNEESQQLSNSFIEASRQLREQTLALNNATIAYLSQKGLNIDASLSDHIVQTVLDAPLHAIPIMLPKVIKGYVIAKTTGLDLGSLTYMDLAEFADNPNIVKNIQDEDFKMALEVISKSIANEYQQRLYEYKALQEDLSRRMQALELTKGIIAQIAQDLAKAISAILENRQLDIMAYNAATNRWKAEMDTKIDILRLAHEAAKLEAAKEGDMSTQIWEYIAQRMAQGRDKK